MPKQYNYPINELSFVPAIAPKKLKLYRLGKWKDGSTRIAQGYGKSQPEDAVFREIKLFVEY